MKHSDSTEMDRLLRRYARRDGETMRAVDDSQDGGKEATGAHMDADELSAYAEGALPEAARARYIIHLADCDACRKIVANLTLATGVVAKEQARSAVADAAQSKSWRGWLAALLSPPVLRYGVPALVLLAAIVVAFVATRMQRDGQSVARNETSANRASAPSGAANANMPALTATDATVESHSNTSATPLNEKEQQTATANAATSAPAPVMTSPADQDAPATAAPQPGASQTTDQTPGAIAGTRGQPEVLARKDDSPSEPAAPPPPPAATPAPKIVGGRDKEVAQKKSGEERDEEKVANQPSPGTAGTSPAQREIAEDRNTAAKSEGLSDGTNRARRPVFGAGRTATPNASKQQERAAETQQVAGRRFRRQGNAWVDTAYTSSRSLTNVARGSEQYRALLADEPGLRKVAEQLGGEVIVVWKSRAYRFH